MTTSQQPRRAWCLTVNNPTIGSTEVLDALAEYGLVRYGVFQLEAGSAGTHHYQMYLELSKPQRMSSLKKLWPGAHLEPRFGTRDQAREYCMKDSSRIAGPWEFGTFATANGTRNDLLTAKKILDSGGSELDLASECFGTYVRYHKGLLRYKTLITSERKEKTEVTLIYGMTGTGKSSYARSISPHAYWKEIGDWWDNYDGTSDVVIDDFHGDMSWVTLLRICDQYPCQVPVKGNYVKFSPKKILITSMVNPAEWYSAGRNASAFFRRVDHFVYMENFVPVECHDIDDLLSQ